MSQWISVLSLSLANPYLDSCQVTSSQPFMVAVTYFAVQVHYFIWQCVIQLVVTKSLLLGDRQLSVVKSVKALLGKESHMWLAAMTKGCDITSSVQHSLGII